MRQNGTIRKISRAVCV